MTHPRKKLLVLGTVACPAPGAPAGLPDGVFHGTRKRSFVPRARAA